jgi:hypothetical protein
MLDIFFSVSPSTYRMLSEVLEDASRAKRDVGGKIFTLMAPSNLSLSHTSDGLLPALLIHDPDNKTPFLSLALCLASHLAAFRSLGTV